MLMTRESQIFACELEKQLHNRRTEVDADEWDKNKVLKFTPHSHNYAILHFFKKDSHTIIKKK